jgi:hypothetical protein
LLLVHVGVYVKWRFSQQAKQIGQPAHTINTIREDERASDVLAQKVVQIDVLLVEGTEDFRLGQILGGHRFRCQIEQLRLANHLYFGNKSVQLSLLLLFHLRVGFLLLGLLLLFIAQIFVITTEFSD